MKRHTLEKKAAMKNGVGRLAVMVIAILLQLLLLLLLGTLLYRYAVGVQILTTILAAILVLKIYGQHKTSSMKMPWIILTCILPVCGVILYFVVGADGFSKGMRKRYRKIDDVLLKRLPENEKEMTQLEKTDREAYAVASYIQKKTSYPVYRNSVITYFDDASKALNAQLAALAKAEHFIFMEYHAIEDREAWGRIQEVLVERVQHGVEVRVFYDDLGSIGFLTTEFASKLQNLGIACRVFNPFMPFVNFFLNNRDHRKITVIDGKVGFTGGYNLADEYFNITHPYGQWKDSGIMIRGDSVKSMTVTFLEMWNAVPRQGPADTSYDPYLKDLKVWELGDGFVQPYADSPMNEEPAAENVYITMISRANRYCYFMTPYLIITDEMIHALTLAAKRGVDVRIITPGIPDKKMIYSVTRSFYNVLVRDGVRIFEWTPGFNHAKMCLVDDKMATCGTINLDYRSLYHHFENGCFFYDCSAVQDMREDFDNTFPQCREVTQKYKTGRSASLRMGQLFLRLFAQLL